jgi:hypothetical protein
VDWVEAVITIGCMVVFAALFYLLSYMADGAEVEEEEHWR